MASNNSEFDKLKKKWLDENKSVGTSDNARKTELMQRVGKWIQEILSEMNNNVHEDTAQRLCETMVEERNIAKEDMEVCTFIVKNLYRIQEMSKGSCGKKSAEEELKDYVRCTTLNLWAALYIFDHCDKVDVVHSAYDKMKNVWEDLKTGPSPEVQCKECVYGELENMIILGKMDMLSVNLGLMNTNPKVMKLINENKKKQQECKEQKDDAAKLAAGLLKNSVTMKTAGPTTTRTVNGHHQHQQTKQDNVESAENSRDRRGSADEGDFLVVFGPNNPTVTVTRVPSDGQSAKDGVILLFGEDAVLLGTEHMSNGVTPASTVTVPTTAEKGKKPQQSPSLPRNVSLGPIGDSFTDFLVKWIERRDIRDDDGFVILMQLDRNYSCLEKIWDDLRGMSEKLIDVLNKEDEIIKEFCENDLEDEIQIEDNHKAICKNLMKIFYFMQGLRTEGMDVVKGNKEEEKEQSFMRCIVGTVAMFKVFKKYCWFEDYLDYALRVTEPQRAALGVPDSYGKCAWMNFEEVKIGTKLIGERVAKWIEEKESAVGDYGNLSKTNNASWCKNSRVTKEKKKNKEKGENRAQEWTEGKEMKEVQEVVEKGTYITGESQKNLLLKIKEGKLQGINKIEEEINKEIQRQKTPQPSILPGECASANFEEGEEAQWDELFTKFSNNPNKKKDSKDYEYSKLEVLFPWCDEIKDEDKGNVGRYQEFCRVLLKNLLMVNNNPYDCEKNNTINTGKRKPCVGKCDLLNIWLMYVRDHCVPSEVIKYVFTGMHSMKDTLPGTEKYANCAYLSIKNLWRDGNDMLNLIMKWMQGGKCGRKMDDVDTKGWCKGGGNKLSNVKLSRKDNTNWDNNANAELNDFMEELKEGSEIVHILKADQGNFQDKVGKVKRKVEMKKQSLLDSGPPPPASDGKEEKGGEGSQEKGTKKSESEKPSHTVQVPEKPPPAKVPKASKDPVQKQTGKDTASPKVATPNKEECKNKVELNSF